MVETGDKKEAGTSNTLEPTPQPSKAPVAGEMPETTPGPSTTTRTTTTTGTTPDVVEAPNPSVSTSIKKLNCSPGTIEVKNKTAPMDAPNRPLAQRDLMGYFPKTNSAKSFHTAPMPSLTISNASDASSVASTRDEEVAGDNMALRSGASKGSIPVAKKGRMTRRGANTTKTKVNDSTKKQALKFDESKNVAKPNGTDVSPAGTVPNGTDAGSAEVGPQSSDTFTNDPKGVEDILNAFNDETDAPTRIMTTIQDNDDPVTAKNRGQIEPIPSVTFKPSEAPLKMNVPAVVLSPAAAEEDRAALADIIKTLGDKITEFTENFVLLRDTIHSVEARMTDQFNLQNAKLNQIIRDTNSNSKDIACVNDKVTRMRDEYEQRISAWEDNLTKQTDELKTLKDELRASSKLQSEQEKALRLIECDEADCKIRITGLNFESEVGREGLGFSQVVNVLAASCRQDATWLASIIRDFRVLGPPKEKILPGGQRLPKSSPIIVTLVSHFQRDVLLEGGRTNPDRTHPKVSVVFPERWQQEVNKLREVGANIHRDTRKKTRVVAINDRMLGKRLVLQTRAGDNEKWRIEKRERDPACFLGM